MARVTVDTGVGVATVAVSEITGRTGATPVGVSGPLIVTLGEVVSEIPRVGMRSSGSGDGVGVNASVDGVTTGISDVSPAN
jgi:hypothetical protein